jgi:two-component system CheB/CheR fusion protein
VHSTIPEPDREVPADPGPTANGPAVVGIGASAGGLEALEAFFADIPTGSGAAFVVVQHLDPTRKGMLVDLLQRATRLLVTEATEGMVLAADRVYVIPPNRDLRIAGSRLRLSEPEASRGLRLPVDVLFRSLAAQRGASSVGVVLSGMGSDGTLGLQAIKDSGGVTFVQDPDTAAFDGMPRSALAADVADVVAPVGELAARVLEHVHRIVPAAGERRGGDRVETRAVDQADRADLDQIIELLHTATGHDVSLYKPGTIIRRIERRMALQQLDKLADYLRFLREHPAEVGRLHRELMIGVTSFFRDPEVWTELRDRVLPALFAAHPDGGALRAWTPACSTGEEAYTLAMTFLEALDRLPSAPPFTLRIFATDIDANAIERARAGVYPLAVAADIGAERLDRFFVRTETHLEISRRVRQMVVFAPHDIVGDPPFTRLDIITCRNLLIYLEPELQQRILSAMHYALNQDGVLVLGVAETVGDAAEHFEPVIERARIYRRRGTAAAQPARLFQYTSAAPRSGSLRGPLAAAATTTAADGSRLHLQHVLERALAQSYGPPAVLTDHQGNILYVSGRTGNFLEPASGRANWNVMAMALDGLRLVLSRAFRAALASNREEHIEAARIESDDVVRLVDVTVRPLGRDGVDADVVLVVFDERPPPESPSGAPSVEGVDADVVAALNAELETAYTELRAAYDDAQSTREEMALLNEELQSTNEELQSINEELTTSMEEMQSMNEELQTLNRELQRRVDELVFASDDMANLLDSTQIATLFLDSELRVRRFTARMGALVNLIDSDVGRPFSDLTSRLRYPELADDVRAALVADDVVGREVRTDDARWFAVRVMPYRTHDHRVDGVVITFTDVTEAKALEERLRTTGDEQ